MSPMVSLTNSSIRRLEMKPRRESRMLMSFPQLMLFAMSINCGMSIPVA